MFAQAIGNVKQFFYDDPMGFLGVCLVVLALIGIVIFVAVLVTLYANGLLAIGFVLFITLVAGLLLAGQL